MVMPWFFSRKRIIALEEGLSKAEGTVRQLQLEWEETFDKLSHTLGRLNKRAVAAAVDSPTNPSATDANGKEEGYLNPLTGKPLDPVSVGILRKRKGV